MILSHRDPSSSSGSRRALRMADKNKRRRRIGLAVVGVAVAGFVGPVSGAGADPIVTTLVVNSPAWGGADAAPGDRLCATVTGECTLRAAIEEANALGAAPDTVLITVNRSIPVGTTMTGTPNLNADKMLTSAVTAEDVNGAYFAVTAPVTIDLGHRLLVDGSANDDNEAAAFYLNGPDIELLNADMVLSPGSSFVVGPDANRVRIDGHTDGGFGKLTDHPTNNPERFVVLREGAANITVANYQVAGYRDDEAQGGIFVFDPYAPYTPIRNIVVDNVQVLFSESTTCTASNGSGCRTRIVNFWDGGSTQFAPQKTTIDTLTFRNMVVRNLLGQPAFQLGEHDDFAGVKSATVTNLTIEDNVFVNNLSAGRLGGDAFVTLPYNKHLFGTTSISRNVFTTPAQTGYAIFYYGNQSIGANSTVSSGVTIADNYFDGYGLHTTVRTERSGVVTVTGNSFGTSTRSKPRPSDVDEETADSHIMYNTYHEGGGLSSNMGIRTWVPNGAAKVLVGPRPAGTRVADDPRNNTVPTCPVVVPVQKFVSGHPAYATPGEPVTVQAYWTADRTAEVYLGQVTGVTGANATVELQLPVGTLELPDGKRATPVDPTTGAAGGYVRLQTHVEKYGQLQSSQYSRVTPLSGTCQPVVTIDQAAGMNDPTYGRDLHFTLTSSIALDTVAADAVTVTAVPVPETIAPDRLNPRVVSVTAVAGSANRTWDVLVRVDDSAQVTVAVAAGAVSTVGGLPNPDPATSTDPTTTFYNPLQVSATTFTLVTGDRHGQDVTITLAAGAPAPQADVTFVSMVSQPVDTPQVTANPSTVVLPAGQAASAPMSITAASGDVTANTVATVALAATSADPVYDGLVVRSVTAHLFGADPAISITKRVYVQVPDISSPERIEATGTLAVTGSRLSNAQQVCFVYTVTNTSADEWATDLTDVTVTDTDTRLGNQGVIGTIAVLEVNQTHKLAACTTLIPVDTTVVAP